MSNCSTRRTYEGEELFGVYEERTLLGYAPEITNAVTYEALVLYTVCLGNETFLQIREPPATDAVSGAAVSISQLGIHTRTLRRFSTRVTSLTACLVGQVSCVIVAQWTGQFTTLTIHPLDGTNAHSINIPVKIGNV